MGIPWGHWGASGDNWGLLWEKWNCKEQGIPWENGELQRIIEDFLGNEEQQRTTGNVLGKLGALPREKLGMPWRNQELQGTPGDFLGNEDLEGRAGDSLGNKELLRTTWGSLENWGALGNEGFAGRKRQGSRYIFFL